MTFEELRIREDVPIIVVNASGIIVFVNGIFCKLLKWKRKNLESRSLSLIIPKVLQDAHNLGFSLHMHTGHRSIVGVPHEFGVVCGDGMERVAEHFIIDGIVGGKTFYAASIVPLGNG